MRRKQKKKVALITGITGQDGSYLAELLLSKNYEVHGIIRRSSSFNTSRITNIFEDPHKIGARLFLHYGDLSDSNTINKIVTKYKPDEIYHLGAQSHVRVSFDIPEYTADITALGTLRVLEAIRHSGLPIRFYNAASSEMYGDVLATPQNEKTPFNPRSPYAISKLFSFYLTKNYREAYGIHASSGILFNHESPRRGETFVTRKIVRGIARILAGKDKKIYLGNLDAKRDWGYAPEYVEAMWLMLQQNKPDDYVIATGKTHSVREFLEEAFGLVGIKDWKKYVVADPRYFRPTEVNILKGDPRKAIRKIGWKPKTTFKDLVRIMLVEELKIEGLSDKLIL
ncbi:MAG: GDP-mannose 4,6-dehydratase [Candidatus Zambryskibacteria bacterium]|nr:GDP-mannose 4,6-dehydratase [Candidatus Zambryskibacteria bacterium]